MSGIKQFGFRLSKLHTVALDSMCFIYHFEAHPQYSKLTEILFEYMEAGKLQAITSVISVAEVFSNRRVIDNPGLARTYFGVFESWPGLTIVDCNIESSVEAGSIRVLQKLKLPDAFQIAAAVHCNAQAFITNDTHFQRLKKPKPLLLRDFVAQ